VFVQIAIDLAKHNAEILIVNNTNNELVIIMNIVLPNASAKINPTITILIMNIAYLVLSVKCLKGRIASTNGERYVIPIKALATNPAVTAPYSPGIYAYAFSEKDRIPSSG
jgi:hypothetical protein